MAIGKLALCIVLFQLYMEYTCIHVQVAEACMLVCSCALEAVGLGHGQFNCQPFVETAVLPALTSNINPFLTGRCLWLASKMGTALKPGTISQ